MVLITKIGKKNNNMIHNVEVTLTVNFINLSQEKYIELINGFVQQIVEKEKTSFNDLIKTLSLDGRKYLTTSIEYPEMDHSNDSKLIPKETKIEIKG